MKERVRIRKRKNGNEYAEQEIWVYDKKRKRGYWKYKAYLGKVVGYDEAGTPKLGDRKNDLEEKAYYDLVEDSLRAVATTNGAIELLDLLKGGLVGKDTRQTTAPSRKTPPLLGRYSFFQLKAQAPFYYELCLTRAKGKIVPTLFLNLQSDRKLESGAATVIQVFDRLEDAATNRFSGIALGRKKPSVISVREMFGHFAYSSPVALIEAKSLEVAMCLAFKEMVSWSEQFMEQRSIRLANITKGFADLLEAMLSVLSGELRPVLEDHRLLTLCQVLVAGGSVFLRNGKIVQCGMVLEDCERSALESS